ncbi:MFS transporter [Agrobacterium rhizogenes]|nr:MFS transporter [Rhizobium rhizogenes]NTH62157.1 MFS transporter [Rhizobium rhizogenes]NTH93783.1 MFS transporter [Rhizobium rhizogenes]
MLNNWPRLLSLALAFLMSMFFRSYFGAVGPMIAADVRLDPSGYGYVASAFFISFGLLQIPLGAAFDHFGAKTPMAVLMVAGALGAAMVGTARTLGYLIAAQALLGIGCAPIFMGVVYELGRSEDRATAQRKIATVSAIGSLGALFSASPLVWLSELAGWRGAMFITAMAMVLCAAAITFTPDAAGAEEQYEDVPTAPSTGLIYLMPICLTLSLGGTFRNAWAGPYLSEMFSADQRLSGLALTIVSVVGIATSFAIPLLISRLSARRIIVLSMGLATLGTAAQAMSPGSSFVAAVSLISLLYSIGNLHPLVMAEAQTIMPSARRGLLLGLLNTLVFFGVAISSSLFGWIAQKDDGPSTTFQIILAVTAISLAIALAAYLMRPTGKLTSKPRPPPPSD